MNDDLSEDPIYKAYELGGGKLSSLDNSKIKNENFDPIFAAYQEGGGKLGSFDKPDVSTETSTKSSASTIDRLKGSTGNIEKPEPTWGEALKSAGEQILPSTGRLLKETGKALTVNLPETAESIGQIVKGLYSKGVGALGVDQNPEEKEKTEALVNALGQHYAQTYGSVEGFKKALAKDPASILADLSLPISGGAGALTKTAKVGSLAEKALALTAKGAQYLDPTQAAVGVARLATSPATWTAKQVFAKTSQVPPHILDLAKSAGQTTDPALRQAFWSHYTGAADATDIFNTAQKALLKIKQEQSKAYLAKKQNLLTDPVDSSKIYKAWEEENGKANEAAGFDTQKEALKHAKAIIDDHFTNPNSRLQTIEGVDRLKRAIWDLKSKYHNAPASNSLDSIYHAAKEAMSDVDPKYAKLMESYQSSLNEINDLTTQLNLGKKASATNSLNKMLRQQRTTKGQQLIDVISEQNPEFAYKLAGATLEPWTQSGARGFIEAALSGVGGLGGWLAFGHVPGALATAGASALAQAPKVVGAIPYAAGAARRRLGTPALAGAYTAEQLRPGSEEEQTMEAPAASADDLFETKIVPIESGGRQSAISPKGAIGVSQIMPSTGPEAAALAGEPWSLERLKTDANYNLKLGKAYFNDLIRIFGDPVIAAAAYNAGKGRVSEALKVAEQTGRDWISLLPPETQNYVHKFTQAAATGGRIERASGGRITNHASIAEKLVRAAEKVKKAQSQNTEALLNHSDDAIATALEVANKHI